MHSERPGRPVHVVGTGRGVGTSVARRHRPESYAMLAWPSSAKAERHHADVPLTSARAVKFPSKVALAHTKGWHAMS
jgi:hypothetical protein